MRIISAGSCDWFQNARAAGMAIAVAAALSAGCSPAPGGGDANTGDLARDRGSDTSGGGAKDSPDDETSEHINLDASLPVDGAKDEAIPPPDVHPDVRVADGGTADCGADESLDAADAVDATQDAAAAHDLASDGPTDGPASDLLSDGAGDRSAADALGPDLIPDASTSGEGGTIGPDAGSPADGATSGSDAGSPADGATSGSDAGSPADGATIGSDAGSPGGACGNGLLELGESCEGNAPLCRGCGITPFLECIEAHDALVSHNLTGVCSTLSGAAGANCWALWNCMAGAGGTFGCAVQGVCGGAAACCYCSDATCSAGVNGACAAQYAAVAGTSNIAQIHAQILDPSSVIARVSADARTAWTWLSPCGGVDTQNGYQGRVVINEVDYDQVGNDTQEFVEIVNGTLAPVDLSNYALDFWRATSTSVPEKYLTIPLSGTLAPNEYLVVGSATVTVPTDVRRIPFALPQDNIDNAFVDVTLSFPGATGLTGTQALGGPPQVDSATMTGTICRRYNGTYATNNGSWTFCHTPTPGMANHL